MNSLPIIIFKGEVLLPHCEVRIDIKNDIDKKVIKYSEDDFNSEVLIITPIDQLEETIDFKNLPNVATVGKIKLNVAINENITRIVIEGIKRVNIEKYYKEKEFLIANIRPTTQFALSPKDEKALIRKIEVDLDKYLSRAPYLSNSILGIINNEHSISKIADLVSNFLPLSIERKIEYLITPNPYTRTIMIIEDIRKEEEILDIEQKIEVKLSETLDKSQKEFILREKIRIIKEELGDKNVKDDEIEKLREEINKLSANEKIKTRLLNELNRYDMMNINSPEMGMTRDYIDWMLSLPWNVFTKEEIDLKKVRKSLDKTHAGLEKVKTRIIEFLAVRQMSKDLKTPIICLVGPPGVGKTTLAKSIAKAINRKFVKISVGGINDEADIIGHRRTYIGANPGRIIGAMKKAKSSNPVFLIDEIDKMTRDYRGDPASALLEVLDKEQNKYFYDNYLDEEYDLSNSLFILTANELSRIPEPLRDRLEIIYLSGYTEFEKLDIAKKHLIPRELEEHGLKSKITFDNNSILTIIRNYTREAGVRELERNIATILRKIATEILEKKEINTNIISSKVEHYLGKKKYFFGEKDSKREVGVAVGLAYTDFGGDILPIEITYYQGKGNLLLTGSLGEIMKESAQIALSYIKSHHKDFKIDYELLQNSDIHIHIPEGAIPKEGPSAGITLTTALISAFTNKPINKEIAMTGEITLRGNVLPIGGLKEKSLGANRSGIKEIIIPYNNERDLNELPDYLKEKIKYHLVKDYKDVYKIMFGK
ncbi:MAG: endopeptidase La [Tenericutes bacterium]|nr:endopeptidase La [Mycoplasmatota bacterium]